MIKATASGVAVSNPKLGEEIMKSAKGERLQFKHIKNILRGANCNSKSKENLTRDEIMQLKEGLYVGKMLDQIRPHIRHTS